MERVIEKRIREWRRVVEKARSWALSLRLEATVVLVGSYARGDFNVWSDVDIVIVSPAFKGLNPIERLKTVDAPPGFEIIPWTPEELDRMIAKKNPLALELVEHGIILRDDLGLKGYIRRSRNPST